ncbi:MAG: hypothetical protein VYD27_03045 [Candidatus Thermoplasmatota archaeon]|nr:hypothetical protein [Candidatus Thermoplasmatota archaeon]
MTYFTEPDFLASLAISTFGISVMSWWLYTRISIKLREVEERNNWSMSKLSEENE